MNDASWLDAFAHELEGLGAGSVDRAGVLVETEGFLAEAGGRAFEHFGSPVEYAAEVVSALGSCSSDRVRARPTSPVVGVLDVSKSYGRHVVLREISLRASEGEVVVLTGPNGAGKSTLLRVIAGLEAADSGAVSVRGAVGYVPQHGGLDPYLKAEEHFALFGAASGLDRAAAKREGNRLAHELGWDSATAPIVDGLSGGTQQKLKVITAFLGSPNILLLDEPYQGMDAESTRRFWDLLWAWRDDGGCAVVSSHSLDALTKASTVVEIEGLPAS